VVTKYPVKKIALKSKGVSTLSGRKIWYDDVLKRLNADRRGKYLGEFDGDDRILTVLSNGIYELTSFDLNNHFDDKMILIEKYDPEKVYSVVHIDGKSKNHLVKRFMFENTAIGKQTSIISEESGSKLVLISGAAQAIVKVELLKGKTQTPESIETDLADAVDVKGMKAMGNRLSQHPIKKVELIAENDPEEDNEAGNDDKDPDEPTDPDLKSPTSPAAESPEKSVESSSESVQSHNKNIDLEITNPDDIDIDDTGQLGLF
jgi:topoisomerase-4 subunit A